MANDPHFVQDHGGPLAALAQKIDIFSRVSPSHKLRIVQAMQQAGQVVAMTGDGINDGVGKAVADVVLQTAVEFAVKRALLALV